MLHARVTCTYIGARWTRVCLLVCLVSSDERDQDLFTDFDFELLV